MEELSDGQLTQIRDPLRAYHRDRRDSEGCSLTWKNVFEEVLATAEEGGIALDMRPKSGADRLRQFVEGVRGKDETHRFPVPQSSFLAAMRAFVTARDDGSGDLKGLRE